MDVYIVLDLVAFIYANCLNKFCEYKTYSGTCTISFIFNTCKLKEAIKVTHNL